MKTYDHAGTKTLTRASALTFLASATTTEALNRGAEFANHPNYHVRAAYWKATGATVPTNTEEKMMLFKSIAPNLFARVTHLKGVEAKLSADRKAEREQAWEHNDKATVIRTVDAEKLALLRAWHPICEQALHEAGKDLFYSQAKYFAWLESNYEVECWLRSAIDKPVPPAFLPIWFGDYVEVLSGTNATGRVFMDAAVVEAMPTAF